MSSPVPGGTGNSTAHDGAEAVLPGGHSPRDLLPPRPSSASPTSWHFGASVPTPAPIISSSAPHRGSPTPCPCLGWQYPLAVGLRGSGPTDFYPSPPHPLSCRDWHWALWCMGQSLLCSWHSLQSHSPLRPQPPVPCTWPGTGPLFLSSPGAPAWQPVMPGEEAMPSWARSHQLRGLGSPWTWERGRFRPTHHVLPQAALHPEAAGPGLRATNAPGRSQPHPATLCPMTEDLLPAMDRAEL